MSMKKIPFKYYQLKKGENLKIVCQKFNVDSTQILLNNQMSPKQIKEGVMIKLQ